MLRKIAVLAVLVMILAAAFASAASLNVFGGSIQAGVDQDVRCDPDGVFVGGWGLETDDNTVRSVRIEGVNGACVGSIMVIQVLDEAGNQLVKSDGIEVTSSTVPYKFPKYLTPESIGGVKIWVEGPGGINGQ